MHQACRACPDEPTRRPLFINPDAAVNRPFELDRLDVQPGAVNVVIGK